MPRSEDLAAQFMAQGRSVDSTLGETSVSTPMQVFNPEETEGKPLGFDLAGSSKSGVIPDGVDYNPPRSDYYIRGQWLKDYIKAHVNDSDADDVKG